MRVLIRSPCVYELSGVGSVNWLYRRIGATATVASLALTVFWGAVTAGRIIFAAIERWFPAYRTYKVLPFVVTVAFVALAFIPKGEIPLGVIAFGLAGLGCSALLPLTISFEVGRAALRERG